MINYLFTSPGIRLNHNYSNAYFTHFPVLYVRVPGTCTCPSTVKCILLP
jgi:hypothetical protein